ncbi:hypothetical protein HRbin19_00740 [bacterium HR19]|nr:hypothetical protein HRbin19_00740 [bacterium HR19]
MKNDKQLNALAREISKMIRKRTSDRRQGTRVQGRKTASSTRKAYITYVNFFLSKRTTKLIESKYRWKDFLAQVKRSGLINTKKGDILFLADY